MNLETQTIGFAIDPSLFQMRPVGTNRSSFRPVLRGSRNSSPARMFANANNSPSVVRTLIALGSWLVAPPNKFRTSLSMILCPRAGSTKNSRKRTCLSL